MSLVGRYIESGGAEMRCDLSCDKIWCTEKVGSYRGKRRSEKKKRQWIIWKYMYEMRVEKEIGGVLKWGDQENNSFLLFPFLLSLLPFSNKSISVYWAPSICLLKNFLFYIGVQSIILNRQHIKKQRHYFASKGLSSQSYGFCSSDVWMWELDNKESWAPKNWCFWTVVLEKWLKQSSQQRGVFWGGMFYLLWHGYTQFDYGFIYWRIPWLHQAFNYYG